jgi:hypothetical protein
MRYADSARSGASTGEVNNKNDNDDAPTGADTHDAKPKVKAT